MADSGKPAGEGDAVRGKRDGTGASRQDAVEIHQIPVLIMVFRFRLCRRSVECRVCEGRDSAKGHISDRMVSDDQ